MLSNDSTVKGNFPLNTMRAALALILSAALPLQALAQPHVIAQLGTSPLVGPIASTPQLQSEAHLDRRLFEAAGAKLGLSPAQYAEFVSRIDRRQLTYVTIPRRLDAMTWSSGGRVYVVRNVVIPANTKGWEIDLIQQHEVLALFVPARCGNLSVLHKPLPAIAKAPPPRPVEVAAAATMPPAMPAVVVPQAPVPTAAPYQTVAATTPTVTHRFRLWPLLLVPIIGFLASHGGGTTNVPPIPGGPLHAPPPGPTPPPTGCTPPPSH
jgi:hypothetical protein